MYYKFKEIDIWPSRNQVDCYMPESFKEDYPSTRCKHAFLLQYCHLISEQTRGLSNYVLVTGPKSDIYLEILPQNGLLSRFFGASIMHNELIPFFFGASIFQFSSLSLIDRCGRMFSRPTVPLILGGNVDSLDNL